MSEKDLQTLEPEQEDYIYRVQLNTRRRPPRKLSAGDRLTDFFQSEILDLLDIVTLYYDGQPVKVNGFAFANDEETIHPLYEK